MTTYGLYMSAAGAETQNKRIQILSNNLANVDTTGFRPDFAIMKARSAEEIERGLAARGTGERNDIGGGVDVFETRMSLEPGKVKVTGKKTDMALRDKDAYFVVQDGENQLLTRAGDFTLDSDGVLRTAAGFPVLAEGGAPMTIIDQQNFTIDGHRGVINDGGNPKRLMIKRPVQPGDMIKQGGNNFRPLTDPVPVEEHQRGVMKETLEVSGVKPTSAMVNLIHASRAYEANIQMIQHQDSTLGNLLGRVLRQS